MHLPVFQTTGEILEYCWARRRVMVTHAAVPLALVCALNLAGALMGIGLTDITSPAFLALNFINTVIFLPFMVTWYRMIILGDADLMQRPVFGFGAREGWVMVWQVVIAIIAASVMVFGVLAIDTLDRIIPGPTAQTLQAVLLGALAVAVIAVLCRLSLVIAMAATDRPAVMLEAWTRTQGLGARMAGIFALCVLLALVLTIPLQFVVLLMSAIVGTFSAGAGQSVGVALGIVVNTIGSLLVLSFPATLFAFVYNRIAEQMAGQAQGAMPVPHPAEPDPDTPVPEPPPEEQPADDIDEVIAGLLAFIDGKPRETAADTRTIIDGYFSQYKMPGEALTEDLDVDGIPARWVVMPDSDVEKVVLLLHGGGFSAGSIASHQRLAADLSAMCGTRVLLPDYRLAPEHPYPAGLDDCVTAYRWLLNNGFKPGHIVIAGDSAGGGLTISTALRLKGESLDQPAALVALSPWVNLACDGETMETKAKEDPIGNAETLLRAASDYLQGHDMKDPLVSPIYGDLRGLPPLLIQVGTREVLLDDSRKLAVRARADDVQVTLEEWTGMIHVWHMMADRLIDGRRALAGIGAFVRQRLG